MDTSPSRWKREVLVFAVAVLVAAVAVAPEHDVNLSKHLEFKSLNNAKQICFACRSYAVDNDGNFPPSLDALFPAYLSDRHVLVSPLMPGEPVGYSYTPGLTDTSPTDAVIIEDKFAPKLIHHRLVVYVNDSACVIPVP